MEAPAAPGRSLSFFGFSPIVALLIALMLAALLPPIVFLVESSLHMTNPDGSFKDLTFRFYTQARAKSAKLRPQSFEYDDLCGGLDERCDRARRSGRRKSSRARTNTPLRKYVFLASILSLGVPSQSSTPSPSFCCSAKPGR